MVSIIVQNISLVYPFVGSDTRFGQKLAINTRQDTQIGGHILIEDGIAVGVKAIDNISLTLKSGDRLGLVGHNGSGKSTLLRVLGGIYPPTTGKIKVTGKVASLFSLNLGVNKEATGLENIKIKSLMYGLRRSKIKNFIAEIAEFSELGEYLHIPVKTYSTGMVMRLMFAIASALNPDILLLDEWVATGDKNFRKKVDERLESMFDRTPIIIIASHNEARIKNWSNKTIRLVKGRAEFE